MKVPGQVSWLSGHHRIPSLPLLPRAEQWPATMPRGCGSPITVAGPQPILTSFPFPPLFERGTAGTRVVKKPTTHWKLARAAPRCQWGLFRRDGGISCRGAITPPFGEVNQGLREAVAG